MKFHEISVAEISVSDFRTAIEVIEYQVAYRVNNLKLLGN